MEQKIKNEIMALIERSKTACIASVDQNGFPNIKAMLALKNDGLFTHYFSTNTSSKRISQFKANNKASIYFEDKDSFQGLMLVGHMEVTREKHFRELLWFDGCEMYYPKGIDDEDYSVLLFHAEWANYYHGLINTNFTESIWNML